MMRMTMNICQILQKYKQTLHLIYLWRLECESSSQYLEFWVFWFLLQLPTDIGSRSWTGQSSWSWCMEDWEEGWLLPLFCPSVLILLLTPRCSSPPPLPWSTGQSLFRFETSSASRTSSSTSIYCRVLQ